MPGLRRPRPVREGDGVAIVSTSSPANPDDLDRLVAYFEGRGRPVTVMPHAAAATGYLAGPASDRAAVFVDLRGAIFVVEEVEVTWAQIDSALTHLSLAGVFDEIAALLVGPPRNATAFGAIPPTMAGTS